MKSGRHDHWTAGRPRLGGPDLFGWLTANPRSGASGGGRIRAAEQMLAAPLAGLQPGSPQFRRAGAAFLPIWSVSGPWPARRGLSCCAALVSDGQWYSQGARWIEDFLRCDGSGPFFPTNRYAPRRRGAVAHLRRAFRRALGVAGLSWVYWLRTTETAGTLAAHAVQQPRHRESRCTPDCRCG